MIPGGVIGLAFETVLRFLGTRTGLVALFCVGAVVAGLYYGQTRWRAGYDAHRMEMEKAAAAAEADRIKDEIRLQAISDYDLCVEYLARSGVPVGACDELRRLPAERAEPGRHGGAGQGRPAGP